jgi:GNAT superfamily N-acetyltransferase
MVQLAIRPALRQDLPAILELVAQDALSDVPEAVVPTDAHFAAFDAITAHPDHELIVGIIDNEVVATLQLSFVPGLSHNGAWRAQVEAVRVRNDLRSAGIGTRMLQWVIAQAKERGCWRLELTTNQARTDAQRFYERLGFRRSHIGMKLPL